MGIFDLFRKKKKLVNKADSHTRYWLNEIGTIELPDSWEVSSVDRFLATGPDGVSTLTIINYQNQDNSPVDEAFFEKFNSHLHKEFETEGYHPFDEFYISENYIGQTFTGKGEVQYHLATAKKIDNQLVITEFLLKSQEPFEQEKKDFLWKVGKSLSYVDDFISSFISKINASTDIDIISSHGMEVKYVQKSTNSIQVKYLGNAYSEYLYKPQDLEEILEKYARTLNEKNDFNISKDSIYPLIKNASFIENTEVFYEILNQELVVVYACIIAEQEIQYLTTEQVQQLNTKDHVKSIALDNLTNNIEVSLEENNQLYQLIANGNLEPSYLLIPEVWSKQNFPVQGEIVVAVPDKNTILATDNFNPNNIDIIKQKIQEKFAHSQDLISDKLFSIQNGKWIIVS